jgi:hypothetical protein
VAGRSLTKTVALSVVSDDESARISARAAGSSWRARSVSMRLVRPSLNFRRTCCYSARRAGARSSDFDGAVVAKLRSEQTSVDFAILKRLIAALEARGVCYAIFGAIAMNLHGLVRATEDLDLFVEPEAANVDRLRQALRDVWDDPEIEQISAGDLLGDYPSVRYAPPQSSFYLDILTRLGDAFAFADLETVRVPFDGLTTTVVTPRMLYRMKKDTVRLKDRADAEMLRRQFGLEPE